MADSIFDQLDRANQITSAAQAAGVRPELVHALIAQESAGNPNTSASPKGALGLMQVMPATAANPGYGVKPFDPTDPQQNLHGGISYLKAMLDHFGGDEKKALAAYNGGPGAVESGQAASFPETQNYVTNVSRNAGAQPSVAPDIFAQLDAAKAAQTAPPAAQPPTTEPGKTVAGFIGDKLGSSAMSAVGGVTNALTHPWDTLNAIGKTGAGLVQQVIPGAVDKVREFTSSVLPASFRNPNDTSPDTAAYGKAFVDYNKKRYGSLPAIGNTLYNDPVGAAMDASSVLGLGGAGLEAVNGVAKSSTLGKVASGVTRAADMVDPISAARKTVSAVVQPATKAFAEHITNVNMQIPKALRRRELNSPFSPAEAVLNENRGLRSNPFTRLSQGGLDKAQATGAALTGQFNDVLAADLPKKYSLDPVEQILQDQKSALGHDLNAQPKQAQVQSVIDNLRTNPNYSKDHMGTVMVPQTTPGTPASTVLGANGQPLRAATPSVTTMVPQQQVVGRDLIPQTAQELNVIKGNTDKGLTFGERGGTLEEALKAGRHGIDSIIDNNVPGAKVLNDQRSQNVVATKALQDAILSRQTKRHAGLAESLLFASPIVATEGHPLIGGAMAIPWAYNTVVKHPTLSSAITTPSWAIGNYSAPTAAVEAAKLAVPASRVNEATASVAPTTYPLNKQELVAQTVAWLKRRQASTNNTGQ